VIDRILGPRVSEEESVEHAARYRRPKVLFTMAALALGVSILFPYWHMRLVAPQFPDGRQLTAYVNRLEGDVEEIDNLNHYVGIPSFDEGALLERSVSIAGILVLAGVLLASLYIHSRWVTLFVLPGLIFPLFFVADLQYWLWDYGHSLDSRAPLADAVGEFTPPIFGPGEIAQFETTAWPGIGLILAVAASVLIGFGLYHHRRAYLPLVEAQREAEETAADGSAADGTTAAS
jgi:hypothetical protein